MKEYKTVVKMTERVEHLKDNAIAKKYAIFLSTSNLNDLILFFIYDYIGWSEDDANNC